MKNSISKRLFRSGAIVLLFIVLIALAGDICIRVLKKTSNLIIVEYLELESIQDLKYSLAQVVITHSMGNGGVGQGQFQQFRQNLVTAKSELNACKGVISDRHDRSILDGIERQLTELEMLGDKYFSDEPDLNLSEQQIISRQISDTFDQCMAGINMLQSETQVEIDKYVKTNRKAIIHSRITIVSLGIVLAFIVMLWGSLFIKKLTLPIVRLMDAIQIVGKGDLTARVMVTEKDELGILASAFNQMLERIEKVTVSRNFYDNVLNSMFNGLIITDQQGTITSMNDAATRILEDSGKTLLNGSMRSLFVDQPDVEHTTAGNQICFSNVQTESLMKSVNGNEIPVLITVAPLQLPSATPGKFVFVFHDLTERKKIEHAMEQIRKERIIAINEAQEKDRLRIATDLHDGLGQILTSASMSLQHMANHLPDDVGWLPTHVSGIMEQINLAIGETKRISHNLIPLALKDFGLVPAVTHLINSANHQQKVRFSFDAFNMDERIDPRLEKTFYRICQEAVNNVLKHARASSAHIQLIKHDETVVLVVEDDGIGFDVEQAGCKDGGLGLASIKERTATFGGSFLINSIIHGGTELIVEIPYASSEP